MAPHLSTTSVLTEATVSSHSNLLGQHLVNKPHSPRWLLLGGGVGLVVVLGVLVFLYRNEAVALFTPPPPKGALQQEEAVTIIEKGLVSITAGTPLMERLQLVSVARTEIEYPLLNVTGYVMARLASGKDQAEARWDFASPEVATAYGDWLNAQKEYLFWDAQAKETQALVAVTVEFLKNEWARKKLGASKGAIPERDVVSAEAEFKKADIQGKKDINEAVTNRNKAERNRGLLERQLFQAGVDPEVVRKAHEGFVLVVADVPEAKIALVKEGQACDARFFGVPDKVYQGKVGRLGPSVSKEKRTLRVTFELKNVSGELRPGMFADIGLGTESRTVLTVPTEAVLHAGQDDYVLKEESSGKFRAVKVKVDEPRQINQEHASVSCVPVIECEGLYPGNRVVGAGAILLKPIMVKAVANGNSH